MKFSENWLRELVDIPATRAELTHRLTMCGLEVESLEVLGESLGGVVIGEIIEAVQQLRGACGARQVPGAELALSTNAGSGTSHIEMMVMGRI